jgi:hypothetical protein
VINLSKLVIFGDGKQVNKESDADHRNSLCLLHKLYAKDTESLIRTILRKRHTHTQRYPLERKIGAFKEPVWKNCKDQFLNPGIWLGQHIFVHTSLRFVVTVVYCSFSRIKWGNFARMFHCFVDLQREGDQLQFAEHRQLISNSERQLQSMKAPAAKPWLFKLRKEF